MGSQNSFVSCLTWFTVHMFSTRLCAAGSQIPHTTRVLGMIYSRGKCEEGCCADVNPEKNVYDSVGMVKSDMLG